MKDEIRPYVHNREIEPGSRLEERILDILDEIGKDIRVSQTLEIFRSLEEIFNIPVELQYIPGNHDRLTNSTPAVITKVRSLLGLPESNQRFDNEYIFYSQNEPLVLVRHGHEYDPVNFALDLKKLIKLPPRIERDNYDRPVVGDFITVEIASRLPIFFKNHYSDERILGDEQLRRLYQRLIEFDNVKPATALLNYLIVTPGIQMRETWKLLEPVFRKILLDIEKKKASLMTFMNMHRRHPLRTFLISIVLKMHFWQKRIPYWTIRILMKVVSLNIKLKNVRYLTTREAFLSKKKRHHSLPDLWSHTCP